MEEQLTLEQQALNQVAKALEESRKPKETPVAEIVKDPQTQKIAEVRPLNVEELKAMEKIVEDKTAALAKMRTEQVMSGNSSAGIQTQEPTPAQKKRSHVAQFLEGTGLDAFKGEGAKALQ